MQADLPYSELNYAARGYSVIPIRPEDKRPYIPWKQYQTRPAKPEEIREWRARYPEAMIGIVTGLVSGLLVIDCDTPQGYEAIQNLLPETINLPMARTPRGGCHLYLLFPDGCNLTVGSGICPGVDFRGEGGYIIAPPSVNSDGMQYSWKQGLALSEVEPPQVPDALYNLLINNVYKGTAKPALQIPTILTPPYKMFEYGTRDNDLFHTANCLVKGAMAPDMIAQVLKRIIFSWGENPDPKWVAEKICSALKRAEKRERNLTEDTRQWISLQEGYFNLTTLKNSLQLLPREKSNVDVIVHRLKKEGYIESCGDKVGVYRRVDKDFERLDFLSASGDEAQIELPLDLHELVTLYPGNIVVVAGSKESGKTAFLLNIAKLMLGKKRIVYLNSEMGADEMRNRLLNFEDIAIETWAEQMEVFNLKATQAPADFMDGSDTIWIIDFLEIAEDFSKIAIPIRAMHEKLGKGLAFIGIQKADGKEIGRGADFSREKARLYLSLDWDSEAKMNKIKIIDSKAWRARNPRGFSRHYKLVKGARIIPQGYWS